MREMDDNYLSESDNFDTQQLYVKANLRVVSTVYPLDATVSHLRHNKLTTDELEANPLTILAAPEPSPSAPALISFVTKRDEV